MQLFLVVLGLTSMAFAPSQASVRERKVKAMIEKKSIQLKCDQGLGIQFEVPEFQSWPLKGVALERSGGRPRWVAHLEVPSDLEERLLLKHNSHPRTSAKKFAVRAWISVERHRWPREEGESGVGDSRVTWEDFVQGARALPGGLLLRKEGDRRAWLFLKPFGYLIQLEIPSESGEGFSFDLFWESLSRSVRACR